MNKTSIALALSLISTPFASLSFAYDCGSQPFQNIIKVGQISPTKARAILKTNDFSIAPELLTVTSNQDVLKQALALGLKVHDGANDGLVRNIDALVYLIQNDYALAKPVLDDTLKLDYYNANQYKVGISEVATLRLMGRNDEANQLESFLISPTFDGGKINELSRLLNYNGKFASQKNSVLFCNQVKSL